MAQRPIFCPNPANAPAGWVKRIMIDFKWHPGMAAVQKKKNIAALHAAAAAQGIAPILEISTKSEIELGRRLSAFNLKVKVDDVGWAPLESAFQGSKVFAGGGPFSDLYRQDAQAAKKDSRLKCSGTLQAFEFAGHRWPLAPQTAFYDWLYLRALQSMGGLYDQLTGFGGFTDIEFNPKKSINCQAGACALFVALCRREKLAAAMAGREAFLDMMGRDAPARPARFAQVALI